MPEALAIIYQVPKTCFVVRFYCTNFRKHCRFISKFFYRRQSVVILLSYFFMFNINRVIFNVTLKFVYEAFKCCTRDRCNCKVNISKWHNFRAIL